MNKSAVISPCGTYRYHLTREWDHTLPAVMWVMLNPSIADAQQDDNTIRRCIGFSRAWGFGGLIVTNLYGLRATNPREIKRHADPVGPENDKHLILSADKASCVVCAWGSHADPERAKRVVSLLLSVRDGRFTPNSLFCLGTTAAGFPRHPLRLNALTKLQEFSSWAK